MPRRDEITIDGNTNYGLNVFDSVGLGGANNPGDVMVIQSMFRYLAELWEKPEYEAMRSLGLLEKFTLEPVGTIGDKTIRAIVAYQRLNHYKVLSVDGIIHPAKYENRNIKWDGKWMTITHLHWDLWMAEDNARDYTQEIARRFPNVAFWVRDH